MPAIIIEKPAKSVLTKQEYGFLCSPPYPFTHSMSVYTGCGFGNTYCGSFCYAKTMQNWTMSDDAKSHKWGDLVIVKSNAPELLHNQLKSMKPTQRQNVRIFMSSVTDPYQGAEKKYEITRKCLEVFKQFNDLDLLVIQTRSPLVSRDFDLIKEIPYAFISLSLETDNQEYLSYLGGGVNPQHRLKLATEAANAGLPIQIVVSPCLPHSDDFANKLIDTGVTRFVVDDFIEGDGSRGTRTRSSEFAQIANYDWEDSSVPKKLYDQLSRMNVDVNWSSSGFCSIPTRDVRMPNNTSIPTSLF